jgi:two-component system LytT family response regulator
LLGFESGQMLPRLALRSGRRLGTRAASREPTKKRRPPSRPPTRFAGIVRALIGSRDAAATALIADVLRDHSGAVALTVVADGRRAIDALGLERFDLVFLDVQLGRPNAFGVVRAVGHARMPPLVLIAPNRDFAARAFEVGAVDYLVRPLTARRVEEAARRARGHVRHERALSAAAGDSPGEASEGRGGAAGRITVRAGKRMLFIDTADIDWIEAGHNFVRLHVGSKAYRLRRTIGDLEAALGPEEFARVHRGILVRLGQIRELQLKARGRCEAVLDAGVAVPVSRGRRKSLMRRLGGR